MKDDYKEGDRVIFLKNANLGDLTGTCGTIRGVATTGCAVIGKSWIVHPDQPLKDFGYSHIVLFSVMLEPVVKE